MRCMQQRSRTKAQTPTFDEKGAANVLGFIFALIILIPAFFLFMYLNAAKTAKGNFDAQVINTARAAAATTYTNNEGILLIDCPKAAEAARNAYELYRPFNVDQLGVKLMLIPQTPTVNVTCSPDLRSVRVNVIDYYSGTLLTRQMFPSLELTTSADALLVQAEVLP